jgi:hypothetical protein
MLASAGCAGAVKGWRTDVIYDPLNRRTPPVRVDLQPAPPLTALGVGCLVSRAQTRGLLVAIAVPATRSPPG